MGRLLTKSFIAVVALLFMVSQSFAFGVSDDQKELAALADDFANAMVKKDKAWIAAHLTEECLTYTPSGDAMSKPMTIEAFTGAVYDVKKSSADNKSFMVADLQAGGSADYTVEGLSADGSDITGTYKLSFKFKKLESGWKISEILINGD